MYFKRETLLLISNLAAKIPQIIFNHKELLALLLSDFLNLVPQLSVEHIIILYNIFKGIDSQTLKTFILNNLIVKSSILNVINKPIIFQKLNEYQIYN